MFLAVASFESYFGHPIAGKRGFGTIVCAIALTFVLIEPGLAGDSQFQVRNSDSRSGVGIGQMACRSFNESVQRLEAGSDDGLYYAFLAWRDGYITASARDAVHLTLVFGHVDEWLNTYCQRNPHQTFAAAVVAFVREFSNGRVAYRMDSPIPGLFATSIAEPDS